MLKNKYKRGLESPLKVEEWRDDICKLIRQKRLQLLSGRNESDDVRQIREAFEPLMKRIKH